MAETAEKTPKTQEELEQDKIAKAAARAKKVKDIAIAIKTAFKLDLKETKAILGGIQGKLSPAELNSLVEKKVITEDQKKICVDCGLQKSATTRTSVSHALPYIYKNFRCFDAANRDESDEFEEVPNAKVIEVVTRVSKNMEKFYEDNKADLDFLQSEVYATLKTYFRFATEEEETPVEQTA